MSINCLVIRTEGARFGAALLPGPCRASSSKIGPDRCKITAILGLGGGQNLLLDVLCINTDNNVKKQQSTVVSGKRGKRLAATNASKEVMIDMDDEVNDSDFMISE